jgi:hypothetical protein
VVPLLLLLLLLLGVQQELACIGLHAVEQLAATQGTQVRSELWEACRCSGSDSSSGGCSHRCTEVNGRSTGAALRHRRRVLPARARRGRPQAVQRAVARHFLHAHGRSRRMVVGSSGTALCHGEQHKSLCRH